MSICYLCQRDSLPVLTNEMRSGQKNVYLCETCDLGQLDRSEIFDAKTYYEGQYRKEHGPVLGQESDPQLLFDSYKNYQTRRISFFEELLKPQAHVLDIGCSAGQVLYQIKDRVAEVVGLDYDKPSADFCAKICGCKTYTEDLEKTKLAKHSFDVILLIHTLHHLPNPLALLKLMQDYLKPGGHVVIEVPNLKSPLLSIYKNPVYKKFHFHQDHYFYFTSSSLKTLMTKAGYNGEVKFFQDYNFLNHLHWQWLQKPQPSCHPGLGPVQMPLDPEAPAEVRKEANAVLEKADLDYKKVLERHGVAGNLMYIGKWKS